MQVKDSQDNGLSRRANFHFFLDYRKNLITIRTLLQTLTGNLRENVSFINAGLN